MHESMNKIYKNVKIGTKSEIGEFVVLGQPPKGKKDGELETLIGDNAVIRSHSVIYAGNKIGNNFQTGHGTKIREENIIGNNVSIGTESVIEHHVVIEDNVRIHSQAFIPELSVLKKGCWLGPRVCLTNAPYPNSPAAKEHLKGVIVEENARLGANSTILPGVVIGRNALVGAGSVVTKDVGAGKVVVGNPARIIKDVKELRYSNGAKPY